MGLPDALAALAASAALSVSDIPFDGPISECRVILKDGAYVVNPTPEEMEGCDLDLIVAGTMENIMMVEGESQEVSEDEMLEGIKVAHEAIKIQCQAQIELAQELGKTEKREFDHEPKDEELEKKIKDFCYDKCYAIAKQGSANKNERGEAFAAVKEEFLAQFSEEELEELDSFLVK